MIRSASTEPRVTVSAGGKFHAFHLAEQLERRGALRRLITTVFSRRSNAAGVEVPDSKVRANPWPELILRMPRALPLMSRWYDGAYHKAVLFDRWASRQLQEGEVFVGWSSFSLACLERAKALGMKTVLERGSTHFAVQQEILRAEFESHGLPWFPSARMQERELSEYARADYIAVPSRFAMRSFLERGVPAEKLILNPYGVDLSRFRRAEKPDTVFRAIFVGNGSLRKGLPYLLKAVERLKIKDFELVMVGSREPEILPFLRGRAANVRHLGELPAAQIPEILATGSVFVLPSVEEGLALVIPQAMACGLPVICTPNTGGDDIVRDGVDGYIVPPRDPDAIAASLQRLFENEPLRREMGRSAAERVSAGFSWSDYGGRAIEAYRKVAAHG